MIRNSSSWASQTFTQLVWWSFCTAALKSNATPLSIEKLCWRCQHPSAFHELSPQSWRDENILVDTNQFPCPSCHSYVNYSIWWTSWFQIMQLGIITYACIMMLVMMVLNGVCVVIVTPHRITVILFDCAVCDSTSVWPGPFWGNAVRYLTLCLSLLLVLWFWPNILSQGMGVV